jgi:uncharacterized protein YcbX
VEGTVAALRRYPVKSMLGEDLDAVAVTAAGLEGDRVVALIDNQTGHVASAKHPRLWRGLLAFAAQWNNGSPRFTQPDGEWISIDDVGAEQLLSEVLQRDVRLSTVRPDQAVLERPAPEDVIEAGEDADLPYEMLEIGKATPGATFVDYGPVHIVTSATLDHVGVEMIRYRPNVVLQTPEAAAFAENDWTGRELLVGPVRMRIIEPTPRCAVPTLAHGTLPRRSAAVRILLEENRIAVSDTSLRPCLGAYAEVLEPGTISVGDRAQLI